jgi:hypothetical protein
MSTANVNHPQSHTADPQLKFKDRRKNERILTPVTVRIRRRGGGRESDVTTVVDNLGAGGFYVRLRLRVEPGENLAVLIRLFSSPDSDESEGALRLAVRGRVLRVEELPGDVYGAAVRILAHRFI